MEHLINRAWWAMVLRGLLALAFGVLALAMPGISLFVLVMLFGGFCLAEGILNIAGAITGGDAQHRWWALLLQGLVSVAVALITLLTPGITAMALVFWIGAWAIITGALALGTAVRLRKVIHNEVLLGIAGVLSIVFGVLVFIRPGAGALAIVTWIGIYALFIGVLLVALGLRMRKHRAEVTVVRPAHAA
ncbi:MAG: HdeD family acid-resistance protein [Labilithrix sp.]|nr:HdeD family acid-resistance protein [Labilithrix sp.]